VTYASAMYFVHFYFVFVRIKQDAGAFLYLHL
jgi:hypothetical protein